MDARFQTGNTIKGRADTGGTAFDGRAIGDIKLKIDEKIGYMVTGSNRVHGGSAKAVPPDNVDWPRRAEASGVLMPQGFTITLST